jgi:hypothetical protein
MGKDGGSATRCLPRRTSRLPCSWSRAAQSARRSATAKHTPGTSTTTRRGPAPLATREGFQGAAEEADTGTRHKQRHHRHLDKHLDCSRAVLHGRKRKQRRDLPQVSAARWRLFCMGWFWEAVVVVVVVVVAAVCWRGGSRLGRGRVQFTTTTGEGSIWILRIPARTRILGTQRALEAKAFRVPRTTAAILPARTCCERCCG